MGKREKLSRRAILRLGVALGGATVLTSCVATPTPQVVEKVVEKEKIVTQVVEKEVTVAPTPEVRLEGSIVVWAYPFTEDDSKYIYGPLNSKFAEEQPGIKVEVEVLPWGGRREKLYTAFAAGEPPDVWLSSSDTLPRYVENGIALALDDCLGQELLGAYKPDILAIGTWEGKVYLAPMYTSCDGRLYNRTMLEEMGRNPDEPIVTWDEIRTYAPKAKEKGWYFTSWNSWNWGGFLTLVWQAGGTAFSEDRTKAQLTSEPAREALQFLVELFRNGWAPEEGASSSTEEGAQAVTDYFLMGQQVQTDEESPVYMDEVRNQAPDLVWDVNPAWKNKRSAFNFYSGNWSITSSSKQAPAACAWVKFMLQAENLGFWGSVAKMLPATEPAKAFWVVDADTRHWVDVVSPGLMANQDSNSYWQEGKVTCVPHFQAAMLGQKTVEQALEDAQRELQAVIDEILAKKGG